MAEHDWEPAGQGWQGKEAVLRLDGWGRARRVVLLRRRLARELAVAEREDGQLRLSFLEVEPAGERQLYEDAVLVTSLEAEILTLAQLYRDRADCENNFDELKNHWGWGGFTTHDLKRCRLMAGIVALVYNWWSLFVRLADPDHHREAITHGPCCCTPWPGRAITPGRRGSSSVRCMPRPAPRRGRCARSQPSSPSFDELRSS